jgi:hypothetical protein
MTSRAAPQATYSSKVSPKKLTMTLVPDWRKKGSLFSRKPSTPTFSRPMELIMPEAVSQMRGSGLPPRGLGEMPLVQMPPSEASARYGANSCP